MSDSPYRPVPPNRWPGLYSLGRRIDATAETVAGVGTTALLLASRGLLWAAQRAADRRLERREDRSRRWAAAITRYLDAARIGELPDEWDQE